MESLYNDYKNDINNLSFWYPKIKDCGLRTPKTYIQSVPMYVVKAMFMDNPNDDRETIYDWVCNKLWPNIPKEFKNQPIFIKNGCFSNKFDANSCMITCEPHSLTTSIIDINYASLMFDTSGSAEIVIRERIHYDRRKTPCIYNGLPLRPEYRLFYDFNKHKSLYIVNYWDWDYCSPNLTGNQSNISDKLIYENHYPIIKQVFERHKDEIAFLLADKLINVTELNGIWSIDILQDEANQYWLIDMAVANQSAYWDPKKVPSEVNE